MYHCKVCGLPILATRYWCSEHGEVYHKECAMSCGYEIIDGYLANRKTHDTLQMRDYNKGELQEVVERLLDGNETEQ